ncbi:MAG: glycosyltransferase family 2 protein [Rubricoccaceae bacterium]|nr:glycosyltransferase family 2 protein [Rubricoccaceae bacterium]
MRLLVLIPAFNEARSIGRVIADLPAALVDEVVVVNNASTDETEANARAAGATVLREDRRGYGYACLRGLGHAHAAAAAGHPFDVVVFLDGDYSDHPEELERLVAPILGEAADLVIGSRMLGRRRGWVEPGALLPQALWGNRLACGLMRLLWGARFTDLGPFRAIRYNALVALAMEDRTWGWTVEMQIKAARAGLVCSEVPVHYRRRIGVSKITGTVSGTVRASAKILWTIARYAFAPKAEPVAARPSGAP